MRPNSSILLFPFFLFFNQKSTAQCNVTVNAGPDQFACNMGDQVTLNGSVTGNPIGFIWTPTAGLDDPESETPNATVNGPMTYTLTGFAEDPNAPNLIINGDFESGNTGFSSAFALNPMPTTPGTYFIATSPTVINAAFPPCNDHTFDNGSGNMMIVNGTGNPADVWCQTITVNPNSYYNMSAWITSTPLSPPEVQFSINGTLVGNPFQSGGLGCGWEEFTALWFSGANTSINLCITDQSTSGNGLLGDFFALDDIVFAEACSESDEVVVNLVMALAHATGNIDCKNALALVIADSSSMGPDISYLWTTTNGHFIIGELTDSATVDSGGIYVLTVTDTVSGCAVTDTIIILENTDAPTSMAAALNELTCLTGSVEINGLGSSVDTNFIYEWTTINGSIESGGTTLTPTVSSIGDYLLTVTDTLNGCTATALATPTANITPPLSEAGLPTALDCDGNSETLDGTGSSTGMGITYLWTTNGGNILSGETGLMPLVNGPGWYFITTTDAANGCTSMDSVEVAADGNAPVVSIGLVDSILNCNTEEITLFAEGQAGGAGLSVLWETVDGNFVPGTTTSTETTPEVDEPGTFVLTLTNINTNCSTSTSVTITQDIIEPNITLVPTTMLDCSEPIGVLDATGSSQGPGFTFEWSTINGHYVSGQNTLAPLIDSGGFYNLTITNIVNGCEKGALIIVSSYFTPPIADAGALQSIGCTNPTVVLDGSGSDQGLIFNHVWTTPTGNIVSGETTLEPVVSEAGTYILEVTNVANGCTATDEVEVDIEADFPGVVAGPPGQLDCNDNEINLSAVIEPMPNLTVLWTTDNGHILSGETTPIPLVDEPGTYFITVTNAQGNCEAVDSVVVTQNIAEPIADAGDPFTMPCGVTSTNLRTGTNSDAGFYQWNTPDGNIVSGETTPYAGDQCPRHLYHRSGGWQQWLREYGHCGHRSGHQCAHRRCRPARFHYLQQSEYFTQWKWIEQWDGFHLFMDNH